nr:PIN-formed family protein [Klebsormidium flaccidum]
MASGGHGSITTGSVYRILSAVVPLYVAICAGYFSVRFKLFTTADIAGINRFVVLIAIPVLSFRFIAGIDLYTISYRLILADTLFKLLVLVVLAVYGVARRQVADLDWLITLWMIATLSNTLIVGVPTLVAMYGPMATDLIGQVVVGQAVIWYPGLMLLYEIRASRKEERRRVAEGDAELEAGAEVKAAEDEAQHGGESNQARAPESTLGNDESKSQRPAGDQPEEKFGGARCRKLARVGSDPCTCDSQRVFMEEEKSSPSQNHSLGNPAEEFRIQIKGNTASDGPMQTSQDSPSSQHQPSPPIEASASKLELQHLTSFERPLHQGEPTSPPTTQPNAVLRGQLSLVVRNRPGGLERKASRAEQVARWKRTLRILGWKLRKSFTVHAAILGLVYSLVAYKSGFGLPLIVRKSLDVLADTGVGLTMFSLGMFMGSTSIFPCGFWLSLMVHGLHFVIGPAIMGVISLAVGLRGDILRVAIIQAALPQAIVSFSFAKEYDAYPEVLSTSITFGTLVSFPVALAYYVALEHF